jgi:hypothetical protein
MRAAGSLVLLMLPQNGLDDALSSLHEIWSYHCDRAALGRPKPPPSEVVGGEVIEFVERPVLAIQD